jgi:hypothetical protein
MADYYSIMAEAVSALDPSTGTARQQLYQRARSAMISELESVYPPFRRSEIAAAETALDRAIMKIEAEALLTTSTWIAANDQGPVIKTPASAANENDAHHGALTKYWTTLNRRTASKKVPRVFNRQLTSPLDRAGPSLPQSDCEAG